MKKKWKISLTLGLVSLATIPLAASVTSCSFSSFKLDEPSQEPNTDSDYVPTPPLRHPINYPLNSPDKVTDYFDKRNQKFSDKLKTNIQTLNENIINNYRLYEWNKYYEKSNNKLQKSKVFDLNWGDYSDSIINELKPNSIFKDTSLRTTAIFRNQDQQFQFFNDFINYMNKPENIDIDQSYNDFLTLRWNYVAAYAGDVYNTLVFNLKDNPRKHVYQITISDWITSLIYWIMPEEIGGDKEPLTSLVTRFRMYYGIQVKGSKEDKLITASSKFRVSHLMLVADDLAMRFAYIPDEELNRYPQLMQKAKRARVMYDISKKIYDVLFDSFTGSFDQKDMEWPVVDGKDLSDEDKNKYFNEAKNCFGPLKDYFSNILKTLSSEQISIKLSDYVDLKDINKGDF